VGPAFKGDENNDITVSDQLSGETLTAGDAADKVKRTVFLDPFVYAPVRAGEQLGRIDYTLDGKTLKSVALTAAEDVGEKPYKKNIFQKIKELFTYG